MKLNTKRTVLVGFAFLSICAFWQMYDNLVPKILTETFGIGESISGVIMAADNVLALFLLPLFGGLSDKCRSPMGRRRPFILYGTLAAVVLMMALPLLTDSYHAAPAVWKTVCFVITLGLLLTAAFAVAFAYTLISDQFSPILYALFTLVGIGWAFINVNSLPMVLEMCKGSEVGKFTGLYYTFSMSAQIATPIVAGWLLENISYKALFPYAAIFALASFFTMGFVKHGDNKIEVKKGLEAFDIDD